MLSTLLIAFPGVILNPLGDFMRSIVLYSGRQEGALTILLATLLVIPTLLIVNLVAQILIVSHRETSKT